MCRLLSSSSLVAGPVPGLAQTEVDVELVLAVDVSRSMSPAELEIQRRGYADAAPTEVIDAMKPRVDRPGRTDLCRMGGHRLPARVVQDWMIIGTAADARAFADLIAAHFDPSLRRTSISGALLYAAESIQ